MYSVPAMTVPELSFCQQRNDELFEFEVRPDHFFTSIPTETIFDSSKWARGMDTHAEPPATRMQCSPRCTTLLTVLCGG